MAALYKQAEESLAGLLEQEVAQGPRVLADHGQQHVHCFEPEVWAALPQHRGQHL